MTPAAEHAAALAGALGAGLPASAILLLLLASFAASALTAAFGLGGGVALLAAMASLLPPAALIPVHAVVQLGSNLGRAALLARHVALAACPAFLAGSLAGVLLGAPLARAVPDAAVELAVGGFVLWSVLGGRAAMPAPGWLAGAVSGALTMGVGATGPFVMVWVRRLGLGPEPTVATHAALMIAQHGLKIAAFGALGFAFGPWAGLVAAMVASGFLGTLAGRWALGRMPAAVFRRGLAVLLCLAAARLIWSGAAGLAAR